MDTLFETRLVERERVIDPMLDARQAAARLAAIAQAMTTAAERRLGLSVELLAIEAAAVASVLHTRCWAEHLGRAAAAPVALPAEAAP